jgi:NADPH-dependent curcumin reductase CurA
MPDGVNHQIVLLNRPAGMVDESCFGRSEAEIPVPGPGEALLRTIYITIDPAIRGWLNEQGSGYLPGVEIGAPIRGTGVSEVVESQCDTLPVGALATNMNGWQNYSIATDDPARIFESATVVPAGVDLLAACTVLAQAGWTAYYGVTDGLKISRDDQVLVSSAAGMVGSVAGQLAKAAGAYVVGIAGTDDKCRWCVDDLGMDACINYRTDDVDQRLKELFSPGVDAFFDNVGGALLDTVLRRINIGARVMLCGTLARDNSTEPYRLANYDRLMSRRAKMFGFNSADYYGRYDEATNVLKDMLTEGSLKHRINLMEGLESAPLGLLSLYDSSVIGKTVIKVSER